tara:strand:+ start:1901 stop:2575 length:675 start_codon:yes stop_codon:yes gene_type:complete
MIKIKVEDDPNLKERIETLEISSQDQMINVKKWLSSDKCKLEKRPLVNGMNSSDWFQQFVVWEIRKEYSKPCIALLEDEIEIMVAFLGHKLGYFESEIHGVYSHQEMMILRNDLLYLFDQDQDFIFNKYFDDELNDQKFTVLSTPYLNRWMHLYKNNLLGISFLIKDHDALVEGYTADEAFLTIDVLDRVLDKIKHQIEDVFKFHDILLEDVKTKMPENLRRFM